jgi:DNA-binding transcriptional LysR family regulator
MEHAEDPSMKDLANLEIFAAVGQRRSFTRAAERLGLPKSSISRKIKELEAALGVKLINRDNRRFELTDQGAMLLESCEEVLRRTEEAFDLVRSVQQSLRGFIAITTTADLAQQFLTDAITAFRLENPEVRIHLDLTPQVRDVVSERFDLALRVGPLRDSSLVARKLCDRQLGWFASADYLKHKRKPKVIEDLAEHTLITTSRVHIGDRWLQPAVQVNSRGLIREFVLRGLGIGLLDPALIASEQKKTFIPVLQKIVAPRSSFYLIFPHSKPPRRVTGLVKKIIQYQKNKA